MLDMVLITEWARGLLPFGLGFAILMLLDFATGIFLALYLGDFDLEDAPRFLKTGALYLWAWLTTEILGLLPVLLNIDITNYGQMVASIAPKVVYSIIVVGKYVGSIKNNVQQILEIRNTKPWAPPVDPQVPKG